MKKILALILSLLVLIIPTAAALAITYEADVTVTNSGSALTMYPFLFGFNTTTLVSGGYISSTGLDTRAYSGSTELPHMLADDKILFASQVPAGASSYKINTGVTELDNFYILTGYSGNVSIPDVDIGDNFTIDYQGYVDSTATGETILYKLDTVGGGDAYRLDINSGNVTFEMPGGASANISESWTVINSSYDIDYVSTKVILDNNSGRLWVGLAGENTGVPTAWAAYSDNQGATWTLEELDSDAGGLFYAPNLAVNSNGRVMAVWYYFDGSVANACNAYRDSDVLGWSPVYTIYDDLDGYGSFMGSETSLVITVDNNDQFHIAGEAVDTFVETNCLYAHTEPVSGGWTFLGSVEVAYAQAGTGTNLRVADIGIKSDGEVFILFQYYSGNSKWGYVSGSSGSWSGVTEISTSGNYPTFTSNSSIWQQAQLVVDDADTVHFAFTSNNQTDGANDIIYRQLPDGGSLSSVELAADTAMSQSGEWFLGISYSNDGYIHIIVGGKPVSTVYTYHLERTAADTFSSTQLSTVYYYGINGLNTTIEGYFDSGFATAIAQSTDSRFYGDGVTAGSSENLSVTAPATVGYRHIRVTADSTDLKLYVDNMTTEADEVAMSGASVPNSSDNATFMSNGTPYADSLTISVDGNEVVEYAPVSYILGDDLPDLSGEGNHGIIHWGENLGDISGAVSGFTPITTAVASGTNPDIIAANPFDWSDSGQAPAQKASSANVPVVSDLASVWSDMWGFDTDNIAMVFLAMVLAVGVFWLVAWKTDHVGYAMISASVIIGLFSIPQVGALPWGGIAFSVLGLITGAVHEARA